MRLSARFTRPLHLARPLAPRGRSSSRGPLAAAGAVALSLGLALSPRLAAAQQVQAGASASASANCPPGSWFCENSQEKPAAPPGQPVPAAPPEGAAGAPLPPLPSQAPRYAPAPAPASAPAGAFRPPPPPSQPPPPPPDYYRYTARPDSSWKQREWGLNLHLEGALLGSRAGGNSGMGGGGFGVRFKPNPYVGVEGDLDFLGGHDYEDNARREVAFAFNALFFVNPRSPVQLYFLAGLGWAAAHVSDSVTGFHDDYGYFGGQIGVGLEFRLAKHFALNADLRGFIRGRIDDNADYGHPEFVRDDGLTSNTSGGGILTGGVTFYF